MDNKAFCFSQLDEILSGYTDPEIVSGHADGADHFGEEYAKAHGLKLSIFSLRMEPVWPGGRAH